MANPIDGAKECQHKHPITNDNTNETALRKNGSCAGAVMEAYTPTAKTKTAFLEDAAINASLACVDRLTTPASFAKNPLQACVIEKVQNSCKSLLERRRSNPADVFISLIKAAADATTRDYVHAIGELISGVAKPSYAPADLAQSVHKRDIGKFLQSYALWDMRGMGMTVKLPFEEGLCALDLSRRCKSERDLQAALKDERQKLAAEIMLSCTGR